MRKDKKPSGLAKFYRRIGKRGWRDSDYFTFNVISRGLRHWITAQLPFPCAQILSIGCGTGELETRLVELGHQVIGVDLSYQMLKRASDRGLNIPVQANACLLPFSSTCFDIVLMLESLGHLTLRDAFQEAARVLRQDGRLLITTYSGKTEAHPQYTKYGISDVAPRLHSAGFHVNEFRYLNATRNSVIEAASEARSSLLYMMSTKGDYGSRPGSADWLTEHATKP
jgi:ubiquinone/menaquinone biosynthesis C-methylase UbiE